MINQITKLAIRGYQNYISPYKGFRCAHAHLHQGDSCSQAVFHIVDTQGLWSGRQAIKQQFKACQQAYTLLQARAKKRKKSSHKKSSKQEKDNSCDCGLDLLDGVECCSSKSCWFD